MSSEPPHSTAYKGFFQTPPTLPNPYTADPLLHRILTHYLGKDLLSQLSPEFTSLGKEAISPLIQEYLEDTRLNLPQVVHWDGWGRRKDELRTPEGWKKLKHFWARAGLMEDFYTRPHGEKSRIVGFTK